MQAIVVAVTVVVGKVLLQADVDEIIFRIFLGFIMHWIFPHLLSTRNVMGPMLLPWPIDVLPGSENALGEGTLISLSSSVISSSVGLKSLGLGFINYKKPFLLSYLTPITCLGFIIPNFLDSRLIGHNSDDSPMGICVFCATLIGQKEETMSGPFAGFGPWFPEAILTLPLPRRRQPPSTLTRNMEDQGEKIKST